MFAFHVRRFVLDTLCYAFHVMHFVLAFHVMHFELALHISISSINLFRDETNFSSPASLLEGGGGKGAGGGLGIRRKGKMAGWYARHQAANEKNHHRITLHLHYSITSLRILSFHCILKLQNVIYYHLDIFMDHFILIP